MNTANTPSEVEAKFQVSHSEALTRLRSSDTLFDQYAATTAKDLHVTDVYFDTADFALLRHGYSLRIRTQCADAEPELLVTMKGLKSAKAGAVLERNEWEYPIAAQEDAPHIQSWPSALSKRVDAVTYGRALHAVMQLVQERTKRKLSLRKPSSSPPIMELSLDRVDVYPAKRSSNHPAVATFGEVEVELVEKEHKRALKQIERRLKKEADLKALDSSKFERGLLALWAKPLATTTSGALDAADLPIAEFCRMIWRTQLAEMNLLEHGVRLDADPEFVHDMRVATRRTRVAMQLFAPFYKEKAIRKFAKSVRKLARLLGRVRDLDVALANLNAYRQQDAVTRDGTAFDVLAERWREQRQRMQARLVAYLDSPQYAKFVAKFADFCASPGLGIRKDQSGSMDVLPTVTRHVLPALIWQRLMYVRAYETVLSEPAHVPFETLHNLRIACKYLRYVLEFGESVLDPKLSRYVKRLKKLQESLGDMNDAAVEMEWLAPLVDEYPEHRIRIEHLETVTSQIRSQIDKVYRPVVNETARKYLARVVAEL